MSGPLRVGLTGGIGSGKSYVAEHFRRFGVPVIDTDVLAREVVAPGTTMLDRIVATWGTHLIRADGTLNRPALAAEVFADPGQRRQLESWLHPAIAASMAAQIAALPAQTPYVVLAIPLLVEADWRNQVDRILVVDCPEALQIRRASARDRRDPAIIQQIIAQQATRAERLHWADDIIDNSSSAPDLADRADPADPADPATTTPGNIQTMNEPPTQPATLTARIAELDHLYRRLAASRSR